MQELKRSLTRLVRNIPLDNKSRLLPKEADAGKSYGAERKLQLLKVAAGHVRLVFVGLGIWMLYSAITVAVLLFNYATLSTPLAIFLTSPIFAMVGVIGTSVHQALRAQREEANEAKESPEIAHVLERLRKLEASIDLLISSQ